jgi:hypothetical protein
LTRANRNRAIGKEKKQRGPRGPYKKTLKKEDLTNDWSTVDDLLKDSRCFTDCPSPPHLPPAYNNTKPAPIKVPR